LGLQKVLDFFVQSKPFEDRCAFQINLLFRKAIPEPDFKYFSKLPHGNRIEILKNKKVDSVHRSPEKPAMRAKPYFAKAS